MTNILQRHRLLFVLITVALSNVLVYTVAVKFHAFLPFYRENYLYNSHHFLEDPRIDGGPFLLLRALGQYDAQWYLKIASNGYPSRTSTSVTDLDNKSVMDVPTYAFFPLYPILIAATNLLIGDIELSAFLLSNVLIAVNVLSLYYVIQRLYSPTLAAKTALLLFLFPFSIFFRSYFAEGLQLLLLIWFAYFLMQRRFLPSAFFLALLNVAKGNSMLLNGLFLFYLVQHYRTGSLKLSRGLLCLAILTVPLSGWLLFNYVQTGDPFFFRTIYRVWDDTPFYLHPVTNIYVMANLFSLPLHAFHYSFLDTCVALLTLFILLASRKALPPVLWWVGFLLWLTPFISHDLMSFTRYQTVSFPLFLLYAGRLSKNSLCLPVLFIFSGLLLLISILFVNWYWIG